MNTHPTFTSPGGERLVVVPEAEYLRLVEAREDLDDTIAVDTARAKIKSGEEELVPADVLDRLLAGENPIRVWREHRALTIAKLAELSGVDHSYISAIEAGRREGRVEILGNIAAVLKVEVGDLVPKPANARVMDILADDPAWHSVADLAKAVNASERHVRAVCEWMVMLGRAERQEGSPIRYKGVQKGA